MEIGEKILAMAIGVMLISTEALAAPPNPVMLSSACGGCHGTQGASAGPSVPSLAGQSKKAFIDAMSSYKKDTRPSTLMGRLAKGYTDAEIAVMADFFSTQTPYRPDQAIDLDKVKHGQALHDRSCKNCHPDNGRKVEGRSPILAGQWRDYLQTQMEEYSGGQWKILDRASQKMFDSMSTLSREDREALAQFYADTK
jgi:sulfide dehydrogenase cytochrome subunit